MASDHGFVWNIQFLCKKKQFPFPLATAEFIGDWYFYNRQRKANMFLLVITAPVFSIGASKFFMNRSCEGNPQKIHKISIIRPALPFQEMNSCSHDTLYWRRDRCGRSGFSGFAVVPAFGSFQLSGFSSCSSCPVILAILQSF
jgi:hypothetical protein